MIHFNLKFIKFIIPIIFVFFVIEIASRTIPNDYKLKETYLSENFSKIETLVLGSSHSYYGVNPVYFNSNTFNSSYVSQSLDIDFEILKKYDFENLSNIILPISYFSYTHTLDSGPESWRKNNYVIYFDFDSEKIQDYSVVLSNKLKLNLKRLFSFYFSNKSSVTSSYLGWGVNYNSADSKDLIHTGQEASKRHTQIDYQSKKNQLIIDKNIEALNDLVSYASTRNINVLLFTPPAYKTYSRNLQSNQLDKVYTLTDSICDKYSNCNYLKLLNDTSFIASDYFDADHLSEIGAKKLSILIDSLIEL